MKIRLLALIASNKPVNPQNYPTMFKRFERIENGCMFKAGLFGFEFNGTIDEAYQIISEHFHGGEEKTLFQIEDAFWRYDPQNAGASEREKLMRNFLGRKSE